MDDFEIFVNKQLQSITHFSSKNNDGVAVGILLDISESIKDMWATKIRAKNIAESLEIYANKANPKNDNFLMVFGESQQVVVQPTNDKQKMLDSIHETPNIIRQGNTRLLDSLKVALDMISKTRHQRKTLIVISDFADNSSKIGDSQIKEEVKRSSCIIYCVVIERDPPHSSPDHFLIRDLTEINGGRAFYPQTTRETSAALFRIAEDNEYQYSIGFKPTQLAETSKKDKWRAIDIKVKIPSNLNVKKKPIIRARRGFYPVQQTD